VTDEPRRRYDFHADEVAYIRSRVGADSYGQIARDLGRLFAEHNGGRRSRSAVYTFATTDEEALVVKTVRIPKPLADRAAAAGIDLSTTLETALPGALRRAKA
jgi:hypothetical protein